MKVAVLSESAADEAALRTLLAGLIGQPIEAPADLPIRSRGWPAVSAILPTVLKHLHFHTDVEAFVVVVDSDRSPVHDPSHQEPGRCEGNCRFCQISDILSATLGYLPQRAYLPKLRTAVGLAVPQIEAWYLAGKDPGVSEATWINRWKSGRAPYHSNDLKRKVYGTDRPSLRWETQRAVEAARRIVKTGQLAALGRLFPAGFGLLAEAVRGWS